MPPRVLALAAHPDDIEFTMAGTLLLLGQAGCELHVMNIANGCCGSTQMDALTTACTRDGEAREAAKVEEAVFHPPLCDDLAILYTPELLARLTSVYRQIAPDMLLLPSPQDYMEDHQNACRLGVSAAFCRGMPNFAVDPPRRAIDGEVTLYHAQPYGHRDMLNRLVWPDFAVDIGEVVERKTEALAQHRSQRQWLDDSQGLDSYLQTMQDQAAWLAGHVEGVAFAEGWRRHNPLGFCAPEADPLGDLLGERVHEIGPAPE